MRDAIHNAMYIHDPLLFQACKNGTAGKYQRKEEENQTEPNTTLSDDEDEDNDNLIELYTELKNGLNDLKKDNNILKTQLQDMQKKLREEEAKNAILEDSLSKLSFANDALMKKLDKLLQKKGTSQNKAPGIEMSSTSRSKNAPNLAPLGSLPNQVPAPQVAL